MKFLNLIIDGYRTTLSLLLILAIAGIYSYVNLPVESTPAVDVPYISVFMELDGVSPEDGVKLLLKPSEIELRSVDGVKEINGRALENYTNIVIEFESNINIDNALNNVRAAMSRARADFPDNTKEPVIRELSSDILPVIAIGLISEGASEREIYSYAQKLKRKIQAIPNVLTTDIKGAREEVLEIIVNSAELENYNISSAELINAVKYNNLLIPAGEIDTGKGRFSIKLPGLIESYKDLIDLPIKSSSDTVVRLGDIASVQRAFKDADSVTLVNGKQAMALEVTKRSGSNMINIANQIKELLDAEDVPDGIHIMPVFDSTPFAIKMVKELEGNILAALMLVLVVVVASLGLRSSLLVSIGIPVSTLGGLTILFLFGYSFNFMVLFGLLLALGMIVDGAIVISEYADVKMAEGQKPRDAYINASVRMFMPVTVSTLTILAVFLPLMFWPGIDGEFMRILPITVFAVISCSWLYALVILPVLGALFGKTPANLVMVKKMNQLERGDLSAISGITGVYIQIIRKVLDKPFSSTVSMIAILIGIFVLYGKLNAGTIYFTNNDGQYGEVTVSTLGNLSTAEAAALVSEVEEIIRATDYVASVYTTAYPVGMAQGRRNASEDEIGYMLIELVLPEFRKKSSEEIFWEMRERTKHLAGLRIRAESLDGGPQIMSDIQIQLTAETQEILQKEAKRIRTYLEHDMDGLIDISDTLPLPGIEWELNVNREKAALYGMSVVDAGFAVQLLTNGILMGTYRPDDAEEEVDIRIRYPAEQRNIHALDSININTAQGPLPISSFVEREAKPRVNKLQQMNGIPVASVYANTELGILPNDKIEELQHWLNTTAQIDPRVKMTFRGAQENQEESTQFLGMAFLFAMLLMMALLLAQFNSFYQGFLVLSAVVMSTAGVFLGHMIFQQSFSILLSGVGLVALAGVVVSNNIILLDTFNATRKDRPELSIIDAAVLTGAQRLRPVFLTAITTGLGLIPLALGVSVDLIGRDITTRGEVAGYWKPLAASLVYGLSFATILTLMLTPMLMVIPARLKAWYTSRGTA
jgi:multidrug efflux pump